MTNTSPTFSLVTSVFNVEHMRFAWREALANWLSFLRSGDELVVAVNRSDDDSPAMIRAWLAHWHEEYPQAAVDTKVIDIDISYTDPAFDGKGKAAATAAATKEFVILLDLDERIVPAARPNWDVEAQYLARSPATDALMIPVIDLIGDERHYKADQGLGGKWYLHKNLPYLTRGVVNFARRLGGVIDTNRSDTCELIHRDTEELVRYEHCCELAACSHELGIGVLELNPIPFVYHLGWLDAEQRLRQSEFWKDVWTARRGGKDPEPAMTLEKFAAIPRYEHRLPSWRTNT